jgi:hypothetical protein
MSTKKITKTQLDKQLKNAKRGIKRREIPKGHGLSPSVGLAISLRDILANTPRMGRTKKTQDKWIERLANNDIKTVKDLEENPKKLFCIGCGFKQTDRLIQIAREMGVKIEITAYEATHFHTLQTNNAKHVVYMLQQAEERLAFWKSEAVRFGILPNALAYE